MLDTNVSYKILKTLLPRQGAHRRPQMKMAGRKFPNANISGLQRNKEDSVDRLFASNSLARQLIASVSDEPTPEEIALQMAARGKEYK